jgi:hypothetical protein
MKFRSIILATLVAGLVLFASVQAQNSSSNAGRPSRASGENLITLEFAGGNVAQYIDAVRQASDNANIVVIGDVTPIQMPSVRLKNVDTWAAVNILNELPQQQKDLLVNIQASISSDESDQARVYTVSAMTTRAGSLGASVESTVISVADVLQGQMTADDLLTAVKIAVDVVGMADEPADIKFHKETGLLIARGSADQVSAIHQVVEQLREQLQRSQSMTSPDFRASMESCQAELNTVRSVLMARDVQVKALQQQLALFEEQNPKPKPQQ